MKSDIKDSYSTNLTDKSDIELFKESLVESPIIGFTILISILIIAIISKSVIVLILSLVLLKMAISIGEDMATKALFNGPKK